MRTGASVLTALLLFQLAPDEALPEIKNKEYEITVVCAEDKSKKISGSEFYLVENEQRKKMISDEEGIISFSSEDSGSYLIQENASPGYYSYEGKISTDTKQILLEPVTITKGKNISDLDIHVYDDKNKMLGILNKDELQLNSDSEYTFWAVNDKPYTVYEEQTIHIPEHKPVSEPIVDLHEAEAGRLIINSEDSAATYSIWKDKECTKFCPQSTFTTEIMLKKGTYYLRQEQTDPKYLLHSDPMEIEIEEKKDTEKFISNELSGFIVEAEDADSKEKIQLTMIHGDQKAETDAWIPLQRGETIRLSLESSEYKVPSEIQIQMPLDADKTYVKKLTLHKLNPVSTPEIEEPKTDPSKSEQDKQEPQEEQQEKPVPSEPEQKTEPGEEKQEPAISYGFLKASMPDGFTWSLYQDIQASVPAVDKSGQVITACSGNMVELPYGTYYVKTDSVPSGYYPVSSLQAIDVANASSIISVSLTKSALLVNCHYEEGEKKDAVLGLYNEEGKLLKKWTAEETTVIEEGIIPGKNYIVKVLNAGSKLQASSVTEKISIPESVPSEIPSASFSFHHVVKMEIRTGSSQTKYAVYEDKEGKKPLKDTQNKPIVIETDAKGKASLQVKEGTYYLKPVNPPKHLIEEEEMIEIEADGSQEVIQLNQNAVSIIFHLKDAAGNYVAGSSFSLLDQDGNTVYEWTTGRQAVTIDGRNMERGKTYILHEKRSAAGYQRLEDSSICIPEALSEPYVIELQKENQKEIQKLIEGPAESEETRKFGMTAAGIVAAVILAAAGWMLRKGLKKHSIRKGG